MRFRRRAGEMGKELGVGARGRGAPDAVNDGRSVPSPPPEAQLRGI